MDNRFRDRELQEVLLCRPDYYRWLDTNTIAHSTLGANAAFDPARAQAQYAGLVECLERKGVRCHFLEPEPHLHYQVYTRDSSQTTPWGVALTQLRMPQRFGEYAALLRFHARHEGFWRYASIIANVYLGSSVSAIRLICLGHSGRLQVARAMSRKAENLAREAGRKETEALYDTDAAMREALFGNASAARQSASGLLH